MGCFNSKVPGAVASADPGFASMLSQFPGKMLASPALKSASTKAFAGVLSKYPALKKFYQVPENVKSEADLVNTPSVKEAGDKFLGHYTDIAKSADGNVNATIQKKAAELNKQGMQAEHLKTYGENLVQNVMKDGNNKLTSTEEAGLKVFTDNVTNKLTAEMAKLPKPAST